MTTHCFLEQEATENILLRVTNVCGLCYQSFTAGETIYYDMHHYRYLCKGCMEDLSKKLNEECEVVEEGGKLF